MLFTILLILVAEIVFGAVCNESHTFHIDWKTLNAYGENNIPDFDYSIEFDKFNLEILIDVNLTYLGYSIDKDQNILGTTYVLDFESNSAHVLPLNEPGTCSNRVGSDFDAVNFTKWFDYSESLRTVGDRQPEPKWYIKSIDCSTIHYEGHFTYKQLYDECTNYDGKYKYSSLTTDDEWINLTLTFYINIVSPLVQTENTGYYRIYQLLSAPFVLAIKKTIMILQPVGIRLFTMSVVAVYKEHQQNDFRLIVVTESAEYLTLSDPKLVTYPSNLHQIHFHINTEYTNPLDPTKTYVENICIAHKNYICTQFWEIYANNVSCPPTVFTGTYGIQFTVICNNDGSDTAENTQRLTNCDQWQSKFDDHDTIDLTTNLVWVDEVCDVEVWNINLEASSTYYNDSTYQHECSEDTCLFRAGKDRIYVEWKLNEPAGAFNVFAVWLINVWLCTTAPGIGAPALNISGSRNIGGCLSNLIDDDGPYYILKDKNEVMLYNISYENLGTNVVRASFIPPISIVRDTLYVHAQIKLTLVEDNHVHDTHGHRLMLNDVGSNQKDQIKHIIGSVRMDASESEPYQNIKDIEKYKRDNGFYDVPTNDEPINNENKNIIQQLNKHYKNNDDNNHIRGPYIAMNANAFITLEIVGLIISGLLLANVCFLMYYTYDKYRM